MQRNHNYHNSSFSVDEYLEHLDRIQRMPSMIEDYPSFPNVHEVLNNNHHTRTIVKNPEAPKKVHFVDDGKKVQKNDEVKSIDAEADGFIQQKHKGFSLCKWDTFKIY